MSIDVKRSYSAGGVVLNKDGHVLVVEQLLGAWSLPKGGIDKGEDVLEAAKREIYEESGINELAYIKDLGSFSRSPRKESASYDVYDETRVKTITIFLFTTNQMDLKPVDPDNPQAVWLPIEEVSGRLSHPKDKEFFESIRAQITL